MAPNGQKKPELRNTTIEKEISYGPSDQLEKLAGYGWIKRKHKHNWQFGM